ncbi:MAG: ribosome biogenesis GTPase Der, partial [Chloroflexota bacterium]|nr:ribosome biogenesis GTPase Der [Chloroflexota bacterium]
MSRPLIAIVGRPNVGKSTLFNRLVGEPRAIVEDVPGTTRDRVYAEFSWEGRDLTLVDTGGLEVRPTSDMAQRVKDQVEVALQEADVIVVVGDGVDGVTLGDREVADLLRRSTKPVVLAVNKADNETRRAQALEFYELALGEPMPVSGYHGRGLEELMDRVLELLPPPSTPVAEAKGMKVAIVGRPNVGKSQLLNSLLGQERAIVSDMPGTTRDALDTPCTFDGQTALLIDTAGLRRKGRIEQGVERYSVIRALRAIDRADVALLVIEATDPVTAQDAHIAGYVRDAFKGMVVVVNKWD